MRAHDKPLALHVFTASKPTAERVRSTTSSGGACVNEAMSHLLAVYPPYRPWKERVARKLF